MCVKFYEIYYAADAYLMFSASIHEVSLKTLVLHNHIIQWLSIRNIFVCIIIEWFTLQN